MNQLLKQLTALFARERRKHGFRDAIGRVVNAGRSVFHQREHRELFELEIVKRHIARLPDDDALSHLSHRYYLSTKLDRRQRIDCALTHYGHESSRYNTRYHEAGYGDAGIALWSCEVNGSRYHIALRENDKHRHEGPVS